MIAWLTQFFQSVSFVGISQLFAAASTTDVVFVLLASKPVFIAAAFITGAVSYRRLRREQLSTERTQDTDRQLPA